MQPNMPAPQTDKPHEAAALMAGIAAFTTWGLIPGYWKLLNAVPAPEILAHRFVWTSLFLTLLLSWQRRWKEVKANLRSRRTVLYCLASGSTVFAIPDSYAMICCVLSARVAACSVGSASASSYPFV